MPFVISTSSDGCKAAHESCFSPSASHRPPNALCAKTGLIPVRSTLLPLPIAVSPGPILCSAVSQSAHLQYPITHIKGSLHTTRHTASNPHFQSTAKLPREHLVRSKEGTYGFRSNSQTQSRLRFPSRFATRELPLTHPIRHLDRRDPSSPRPLAHVRLVFRVSRVASTETPPSIFGNASILAYFSPDRELQNGICM